MNENNYIEILKLIIVENKGGLIIPRNIGNNILNLLSETSLRIVEDDNTYRLVMCMKDIEAPCIVDEEMIEELLNADKFNKNENIKNRKT